jgi:hypothetical protein
MRRKNEEMNDLTRWRRRLNGLSPRNRLFTCGCLLLVVYFLYSYNFILHGHRAVTGARKHTYRSDAEILYNSEAFANKFGLDRLNKLLEILQRREVAMKPAKRRAEEEDLKLFSFERIKRMKLKQADTLTVTGNKFYEAYANEIDTFLRVNPDTHLVEATEEFGNYLRNLSVSYALKSPRNRIYKSKLDLVRMK